MGWWILAFLAMVAVFTLITYGVGRLISAYIQRHIQGRLDALDQIVNEERVPDAWLAPYRSRASRLRRSGAGENRIRNLEKAARKKCLRQIEELRQYAIGSGVADTDETKRLIEMSLKEQARRWRDDVTWHELVALTQPEPTAVDDTHAAGEGFTVTTEEQPNGGDRD